MGIVNRDLVVRHHGARHHAAEIARVIAELAPPADRPADAPWRELARTARAQLALDYQLTHATNALAGLHGTVAELEAQVAALTAERDALVRDAAVIRSSRRYRLAEALARPLDAARRR
jgi:hypothetical protein